MAVTFVNPENHMAPAGHYSHAAIVSGASRLAFIAGQVALDGDGSVVGEDAGAQFEKVFANLVNVIDGLGAKPSDIAELRTFLVGNESLPGFRSGRERAFRRWFPDGNYPPNTLLVVSGLAQPELKVEVAATVALAD